MGILPLEFPKGLTRKTLNLTGSEIIDIVGLTSEIKPRMTVKAIIHRENGNQEEINLICRIDTLNEVEYYRHGGILQYVLRSLLST
jgi:aconitate hydratase